MKVTNEVNSSMLTEIYGFNQMFIVTLTVCLSHNYKMLLFWQQRIKMTWFPHFKSGYINDCVYKTAN